jgi:beta-glucanase (GH16 family)
LDVFGNNSNDGNELGVWGCNNQDNERFYINAVSTPSWHTDWVDNFDGSYLDRGKWTVVSGSQADFNGEAQWYVDEEGVENNFWVSNGELKIKIQQESRTFGYTKNFTSGRLTTKGKFAPANGAWESRLVFWSGAGADGVWPAFWLLGANVNEQPYPGGTCWPMWSAREIDIFEYTMNEAALNPGAFVTNFIQGGGCQQAQYNRSDVYINPYGYNTYRMEFWGGEAKIFVNGQFIRSVNDDPWQDQGYAAILNVAIGGGLGGPISWPGGAYAGITVDYVKHEAWW